MRSTVHLRRLLALLSAGAFAMGMGAIAGPAAAVNDPARSGGRAVAVAHTSVVSAAAVAHTSVVSANPADFTPHVMDGSVQGITQIGNKIVAVGTFTTVRQTLTSAPITRNGIFAFDATSGVIDPNFDPNLGGTADSVDTDGTFVYVGGAFASVGGNAATKRVAKLTAAGANVAGLQVPNKKVSDVVVRGSRLYIAGSFTQVGGAGTPRTALAALDTTTGAVLPDVNVTFAGLHNGGATGIAAMDVSPDGTKLVAIGNFTTVRDLHGTFPREQIVLLALAGDPSATVSSWRTSRYEGQCASYFDTYLRDIDFSPDGSYFAVTSAGAYVGGANSGLLCDTTTRWESNRTGDGQQPTWTDYTGGDTTYGVASTGAAIYVGGHMRWENNPFQGDQAGGGAVPREGIAALDPVNGLPLSWNPGRARGVGTQALYPTSAGLWLGSDTDDIGNPGETHGRIALMPVAGGTLIPQVNAAPLPNDLFLAQRTSPGGLQRRAVDGSGTPTGPATTTNTAIDWSLIRGAFLLNGTLYYGLGDGGFYARTFNRTTGAAGARRVVNLYDDPDNGARIPFAIANVTGMFYDSATHRIYYTLANDTRLYSRYFTPESEVVGAQTFVGTSSVALNTVSGMTLAGNRVLFGSSTDGALRSVAFTGGQITGSATVTSNDGTWKFRAIVVPNT